MIWAATGAESGLFGPVIRLLALTGQREAEVAGLRWREIDLEQRLWKLPAARAKNNEVHEVPLSDAAIDILKSLPRIKTPEGFVFPGPAGKPVSGFAIAKARIDDLVAEANGGQRLPHWVVHDLRRTVASGMAKLGIALPVIEKILNHRSGTFSGIIAVYQRHDFADEKRKALDAWASHVNSVVTGRKPGNVVPLRKAEGAQ
jgi:integrase